MLGGGHGQTPGLPKADCFLTVALKYQNLVFKTYSRPEGLKANSV